MVAMLGTAWPRGHVQVAQLCTSWPGVHLQGRGHSTRRLIQRPSLGRAPLCAPGSRRQATAILLAVGVTHHNPGLCRPEAGAQATPDPCLKAISATHTSPVPIASPGLPAGE